jgi:hypothetical protein
MDALADFVRLVETVGLIARHPDYPGKRRVVEDCRAEVDGLVNAGRISAEQGQTLLDILADACHPAA